jgi:hypothetical protein
MRAIAPCGIAKLMMPSRYFINSILKNAWCRFESSISRQALPASLEAACSIRFVA